MKKNKTAVDETFSEEELKFLKEVLDMYVQEECEKYNSLKNYDFSDDFKRNMNKIFREVVGSDKIPHPEVEN